MRRIQKAFCVWVPVAFASAITSVSWAEPLSPSTSVTTQSARELRQLQESWQRERNVQEFQDLQSRDLTTDLPPAPTSDALAHGFMFDLQSIGYTESLVLSPEELTRAVKPWVGRKIATEEIADILNAVNALYRAKGYVVCQAVVKPQRISNGHLVITLIEGRTEKVTVSGNETTDEHFIRRAFDFKEGEVANYRDMIEALVRFNMTQDVALQIDITAGEAPLTTAYRITAQEPSRWGGALFADSIGSDSTGRARLGASITNRSVLGYRDAFTLLGLVSEGSQSAMLSYAFPLSSLGTKLLTTVSYGQIKVIDGPSEAFDISGDSLVASLRLEHPLHVNAHSKLTLWGEVGFQSSSSDMFTDVTVADTDLTSYTAGLDGIVFSGSSLLSVSANITRHSVDEKLFNKPSDYQLFSGNVFARHGFESGLTLAFTGRWQSTLGGDSLNSVDYFYLGHTSGVRGYDNDLLSAQAGFTASLEASYPLMGDRLSAFAFMDAGRLAGQTVTTERSLYSAGLGLNWSVFENSTLNLTASFPLKRSLADQVDVDRARVDASFVMTW